MPRDDRTRSSILWNVAVGLMFGWGFSAKAHAADDPKNEFFETSIRPILVERCQECHGTTGKPKGGLRLDSREAILQGGDSGPAAVVGKPDESLVVQALHYVDEPRMPPKGKLADQEIAAITRWVKDGLTWPNSTPKPESKPNGTFQINDEDRRFWSFQPIKEPARPEVRDRSWPKSDIDAFILAGLEAKGLKPASLADRRALIRRATFDLTGLPPTPDEVESFVNDIAPEPFAKVVDRLLASPHYGERWGRHWLDLVRYTDSFDARIAGTNNEMDVNSSYFYRDWVIDAFNRDLPYDQFVSLQIAGDLIPGTSPDGFNREGIIATGMLAIGNWGGGDADKEKLLTDIADDQVDVVSRAFMGLTIACARCHDHKFDPISTKDYYGLAGIFFSTHILPNVGPKTNGPPMLRIPLISESERLADESRAKELATVDEAIKAKEIKAKQDLVARLNPELEKYVLAACDYFGKRQPADRPSLEAFAEQNHLVTFALTQWGRTLGFAAEPPLLNVAIANVLGKPGIFGWRTEVDNPSVLVNTTEEEVPLLTFKLPAKSVSAHPGPSDSVAIGWKSPIAGRIAIRGTINDSDPSCGNGVSWTLERHSNGVRRTLADGTIDNGSETPIEAGTQSAVDVRAGDLIELVVSPKSEYSCDTTRVTLTIASEDGKADWDLARDAVATANPANPFADRHGHPNVWRFQTVSASTGAGSSTVVDQTPLGKLRAAVADPKGADSSIREALKGVQANPLPVNESHPFWVRSVTDESAFSEPARKELAQLRERAANLRAKPPGEVMMANGALDGGVPGSPHEGVHDVKVHIRGSYSRLGDLVPRHFPTVLTSGTQPSITQGSGRLELARWLTSSSHPLTARVIANRVWQHHFGAAIVRTPSNFGKLGERPSHPELLDHLANRLIKLGWSLKALHREIMLSSVYQQSADGDPNTFKADPDNLLFSRMNHQRLEAESLRDSLLATSGLLDRKAGGPPFRDLDQPRRSVYLMTIRSDRSSFGPLFDAADPTAIVDTRTVSTVAPQALFMLNNPFVANQAKALAKRLADESPKSDPDRIDRAYERLYARRPTGDERRIALETLASLMNTTPDRLSHEAAWESLCHILYCNNEFLYLD